MLTALATSCGAQSLSSSARPFALKLGVFSPTSEETRQLFGKTHFLLEATYDFGKAHDGSMLYGAYADSIFTASGSQDTVFFNEQSGSVNDEHATGRASAYGIGLQSRYLPRIKGRTGSHIALQPYIGAGLGIYSVYGKQGFSGYDDGNFSGDFSHTTTGLGGKIMAGVESRSGFLGEVSFNRLPNDDGLDLTGYGAALGYRF